MFAARVALQRAKCGFVVPELIHQRGDEDGSVEQRTHSTRIACDARVTSIALGTHECTYVERGAARAVMHENPLLANQRRLGVGPAKGNSVDTGLDLELAPRREVELLAKWFRDDQTPCVVNGNYHAAMVCGVATRGQ